MDFLGTEIAKLKRKAPQEEKYIRRSEIEAKRQEDYTRDKAALKAEREKRESDKIRRLEEHESSKRRKLIEKKEDDIPDAERTRAALKDLKEPIQLFGESHVESYKRLVQIQGRLAKIANSSHAVLEEVYADPADKDLPSLDTIKIKAAWSEGPDSALLSTNLFLLFRGYIHGWQSATTEKDAAGLDLYIQARGHLSRLLIRLKANTLPSDILRNLSNIALSLRQRDFTAANHAYLQMSIGKATWPVGVTMVGIHERAQRERQHKQLDSAHILSDEMTRQWLQSLKRLITHQEKLG